MHISRPKMTLQNIWRCLCTLLSSAASPAFDFSLVHVQAVIIEVDVLGMPGIFAMCSCTDRAVDRMLAVSTKSLSYIDKTEAMSPEGSTNRLLAAYL